MTVAVNYIQPHQEGVGDPLLLVFCLFAPPPPPPPFYGSVTYQMHINLYASSSRQFTHSVPDIHHAEWPILN